eukprot:TRINITY_DN3630_c0_g1_i1.p1 TRINITY_DN3630_c0_g1~~TRINITY_DN3630_c0_g1_i1.p1  ORF type:complete len:168 (-),score=38.28 TRINITY_DN3630_c0_g1_i1:92-595(-)
MIYMCFFFFKQKTAYEISACLVGSEMCIRDRFLILVFSLLGGQLQFDLLFSVLLAYLHVKSNIEYIHPSASTIQKIENIQCLRFLTSHSNFISYSGRGEDSGIGSPGTAVSTASSQQQAQPQAAPVRPFSGKPVQIGGSNPGTIYNNAGNPRNERYNQLDEEEDTQL